MDALKAQLNRVIEQHERDCRAGYDGVFLPGQLEKKYRDASWELIWQWFFPAKELTVIPEAKERKRYHIHDSALQKALRAAVKKAKGSPDKAEKNVELDALFWLYRLLNHKQPRR